MKKTFLATMLALVCGANTNAQVTVEDNGYVGICCTGTAISPLSVGTGWDGYTACVNGSKEAGLISFANGVMYNHWAYAFNGTCPFAPSGTFLVGVRGGTVLSSPRNSGRSYGVYGTAGNATSGWNYGIFGRLEGSNNGAAVYGTIATSGSDNGMNTGGKYAAFFDGPTKVVGNLNVTGSISGTILGTSPSSVAYSDESGYVQNLSTRLGTLRATAFYHDEPANAQGDVMSGDTVCAAPTVPLIEHMANERVHYGLQIEQLKESFPELVYEQEDGTTGINYMELIPILVQTINELGTRIKMLEDSSAEKGSASNSAAGVYLAPLAIDGRTSAAKRVMIKR